MSDKTTWTEELKINQLYNHNYTIPIYQRNYAWGVSEVTQLIKDIADSATRRTANNKHINYYIGTLVVHETLQGGETTYETIDGQQRLTTLSILLSVIKNKYKEDLNGFDLDWFKLSITFKSRAVSTRTLELLFNREPKKLSSSERDECNKEILVAYEIVASVLKSDPEIGGIKGFCKYLFNHVLILRVSVPKGTNLNHYFEIMNSRGEQLEKHEILKVWCLNVIKDNKSLAHAFTLIWEACSNMDKYVQYGFKNDLRTKIFGDDWDSLKVENIDKLAAILSEDENSSEGSNCNDDMGNPNLILKGLLEPNAAVVKAPKAPKAPVNDSNDVDASERFNSVINFPNFLLHILMIQIGQEDVDFFKGDKDKKVALDDKRLLKFFDSFVKNEDKDKSIAFVKKFGFNLLKCRFLLDKYIIKREFVGENVNWSLLSCKPNYTYGITFEGSENKELIMLLSMFHVSSPTQNYNYWLNAALKYLFQTYNNEGPLEIKADAYKNYLEGIAKAFLRDHFLAVEGKRFDYLEIIYTNDGKSKNTDTDIGVCQHSCHKKLR